jgi:hypothetical protein
MRTIHPIRGEWFEELLASRSSHNSKPYIFEFRNVGMCLEVCEWGPIATYGYMLTFSRGRSH